MASMLYKWLFIPCLAFIVPPSATIHPVAEARMANAHPFYIAVTEVNQNADEKTLEISCKMFADDLEAILEKNNKTTLDITVEKDRPSFDKYISEYISRNLAITVDGKSARLNYIGFEADKESAYAYFEVQGISSAKKLDIRNSILHDFTNEQINIMHVTVNGSRQSSKLVYPSSQASFSF